MMSSWHKQYTRIHMLLSIVVLNRSRVSQTVGAIPPYRLRLRRKESFWTRLCVFCLRWRAGKTHTNVSNNLWSPQVTRLYGGIALTVAKVTQAEVQRAAALCRGLVFPRKSPFLSFLYSWLRITPCFRIFIG